MSYADHDPIGPLMDVPYLLEEIRALARVAFNAMDRVKCDHREDMQALLGVICQKANEAARQYREERAAPNIDKEDGDSPPF